MKKIFTGLKLFAAEGVFWVIRIVEQVKQKILNPLNGLFKKIR